jgi:hypothetical protein
MLWENSGKKLKIVVQIQLIFCFRGGFELGFSLSQAPSFGNAPKTLEPMGTSPIC